MQANPEWSAVAAIRAPGPTLLGRDGETVAAAGASDESRMVTGQVLPVDSGVTIS